MPKHNKIFSGLKPGSSQIPNPPPLDNSGTIWFSFKFFDCTTKNAKFSIHDAPEGYWEKLMERLKAISSMTCRNLFHSPTSKSLRGHPITFSETSEPTGFSHLNEQFRAAPAFQVSVTANEYGRVHGIVLGDVFYVVWLDHSHKLYPGS
jgi:hypothetical protein